MTIKQDIIKINQDSERIKEMREELEFELRANFEEPEKVVNILTGRYVISGKLAYGQGE